MPLLQYTLLADGQSDRVLARFIDWALFQTPQAEVLEVVSQVADLRHLRRLPKTLGERMRRACEQYPCDILFVHRDAETASHAVRVDEIRRAAALVQLPPHVAVVPVRMTETWLLLEEQAIRAAADNPKGTVPLRLPRPARLEREADPKAILHQALERASEKHGRHLARFQRDLPMRVSRVADHMSDFSRVRELPAFRAFEIELQSTLARTAAGTFSRAGRGGCTGTGRGG